MNKAFEVFVRLFLFVLHLFFDDSTMNTNVFIDTTKLQNIFCCSLCREGVICKQITISCLSFFSFSFGWQTALPRNPRPVLGVTG